LRRISSRSVWVPRFFCLASGHPVAAQAAQALHLGGVLPAFPDRQARQPPGSRRDHHVRCGNGAGHPIPLAREQHPHTLDQQRRSIGSCVSIGSPWSAGCDENRTSGAEGGPGKRTRNNPGTAPRSDPYIIGADSGSAIGTLVERTTRFTMRLHLPADHGATAVRDAITTSIATLPAQLRRSLTWDQGIELSEHLRLPVEADLPVFFCDPHSPWQRGTNETPTACCGSTTPRAPTCPCTPPSTSPRSPPHSTADPARHSAGKPPAKPSQRYSQQEQHETTGVATTG